MTRLRTTLVAMLIAAAALIAPAASHASDATPTETGAYLTALVDHGDDELLGTAPRAQMVALGWGWGG